MKPGVPFRGMQFSFVLPDIIRLCNLFKVKGPVFLNLKLIPEEDNIGICSLGVENVFYNMVGEI